jgi:hypothetical protein
VDPIADIKNCTRDIAEFQKLGINTVRVYTVDNSANHDACMTALANAGIYLALDVNSPNYSLNRASERAIQISYNAEYLQSVFATIDSFSKYENTLLFFSGNEVINDNATSFAAPYIKAVTRDMKAYIAARGYRSIPVGYSAADVSWNKYQMATYMNCGDDAGSRGGFFAFNDYSWCDPSSFVQSMWSDKVKQFTGYGVPLFLSEYGCNTNARTFEEVESLYSVNMTPVYSGGLVYEYSDEPSNYGLVTINPDGSITERPDFTALQGHLAANPAPSGDGGYSSSGAVSQCPAYDSPSWAVNTTQLPSMPSGAAQYLKNGSGKAPGLTGNSQTAGAAIGGSSLTGFPNTTTESGGGGKKGNAPGSFEVPGWIITGMLAVVCLTM